MDVVIEACSSSLNLSDCVHLMPCGISHNGPAPVSSYFVSSIRTSTTTNSEGTESMTCERSKDTSNHDHLTSSFRGRPLNGCKLPLPAGYTGIVVEESRDAAEERFKPKQSAETVEKWKILGDFQKLTYWNWDKMASDNDGVQGLFQWTRIAQDQRETSPVAVNGPVKSHRKHRVKNLHLYILYSNRTIYKLQMRQSPRADMENVDCSWDSDTER